MHELSICEELMQQVTAIAEANHAVKVVRIIVKIGPLAGIEAKLLESAFTISRAGTLAQSAELLTERLPIRMLCHSCGTEFETEINNLICQNCGDFKTQLLSGDELILARVELEQASIN